MRAFWQNPKARLGCIIVGALMTIALLGQVLMSTKQATSQVGKVLASPSAAHWFGTTIQGQDVFAQTVLGAGPTIFYAVLTGIGVTFLSILIGVCAGFLGGRVDRLLSLLINVFLLIPGLPLMIVLAALLPAGPLSITVVLVLTGWPWGARVLRSQAMSLRQRPFIEAARLSGDHQLVIIFLHLVPNMASLIGTSFIGATTYAVGAAVGLEFLGFGEPSQITWGTNLYWATNDQSLLTGAWWTFLPTGLGIALFAFGLVLMTFALDEITNPSLKTRRVFRKRTGCRPDLDTVVWEKSP